MTLKISPYYSGEGPYYKIEHIRTLGVSGWWVVDYDGLPVEGDLYSLLEAKTLMEELEKKLQDLYRSQKE